MLLTLDQWYMPEYIFNNASIVYIRRENEAKNNQLVEYKVADYKKRFNAKIINIKARPIELSSSMVREAIKNGIYDTKMVSPEILKYIMNNNLYRDE